jgi:hypothetical protein
MAATNEKLRAISQFLDLVRCSSALQYPIRLLSIVEHEPKPGILYRSVSVQIQPLSHLPEHGEPIHHETSLFFGFDDQIQRGCVQQNIIHLLVKNSISAP